MARRRTAARATTEAPLPRLDAHEVVVVGIDPGLNGGIAAIHGSRVVLLESMPLCEHDGREWVCTMSVDDWFARRLPRADYVYTFVERSWVHRGNDSRTVFRLGAAYGAAVGVAKGRSTRVVPVDVGNEGWQRVILPGVTGRAHLKRASVEFCRRRWPAADLVPPGCRTPHDGRADALCIATHGQAMLTGTLNLFHHDEPAPVRQRHGRRA